jgi:hypothetical protein
MMTNGRRRTAAARYLIADSLLILILIPDLPSAQIPNIASR